MKIKIGAEDVKAVFEYLDKDKDGYIKYLEFCGLCEEKRRNIDPFEMQDMYKKIHSLKDWTPLLGSL